MPSKAATPYMLASCAPPHTMQSCSPLRMSSHARPMACEPEAQAPEAVRLMPLRWNRQARFMVTVEFMDWKMAPLPQAAVSWNSRNLSSARIVASATESLP